MTARERVARAWHAGSDHAANGVRFGGPLCNCERVAGRIMPMLAEAWGEAYEQGICDERTSEDNIGIAGLGGKVGPCRRNPYESEEGRHVDQ